MALNRHGYCNDCCDKMYEQGPYKPSCSLCKADDEYFKQEVVAVLDADRRIDSVERGVDFGKGGI